MALVKYGAGIIQMSGSIAGNVHARNHFGNYIRPRTKPVNPHSFRQEIARKNMSHLAEYWHSNLNDTQRGLWEDYAKAIGMLNRLSDTIHLTGFNHFIRTNGAHMKATGVVIADAPGTLSLPKKDINLACSADDITDQEFTFIYNIERWGAEPDNKKFILLYQGRPQLKSRNQFATPWRYMGNIGAAEGPGGTAVKKAAFPFALNQKVWFRARLITQSGRLSTPWQLTPKIIADDAA